MRAVLISIQPKWCNLIANGIKTVEVRNTKPKIDATFKVYIYCTKETRKNIGHLYINNGIGKKIQGITTYRPKTKEIILMNRYITELEFYSFLAEGRIIGEFVCDKIIDIDYGIEEGVYFDGEFQEGFETDANGYNPTCLSFIDLENYLTKNEGYGWHISNLVIYDEPKELSEFRRPCKNDLYCESCAMYSEFEKRCYNEALQVTKPPQSWCYVEARLIGNES